MVIISIIYKLQEFEQSNKARGLGDNFVVDLDGMDHDVRPPAARDRDKKTDLA